MKALQNLIIRIETSLSFWSILAIVIGLNIFWTVTLEAFGSTFEQTAGIRPLDLQNVSEVLSAPVALEQISTYSTEARTLYWSFFILDNIVPLVTFGAFSLLWSYFMRRDRNSILQRLLHSPFLLIPLGVGFFDIIENLYFISAIAAVGTGETAQGLLEIGLLFVRLKAFCLFTTFITTMIFAANHLIQRIRGGLSGQPANVPAGV